MTLFIHTHAHTRTHACTHTLTRTHVNTHTCASFLVRCLKACVRCSVLSRYALHIHKRPYSLFHHHNCNLHPLMCSVLSRASPACTQQTFFLVSSSQLITTVTYTLSCAPCFPGLALHVHKRPYSLFRHHNCNSRSLVLVQWRRFSSSLMPPNAQQKLEHSFKNTARLCTHACTHTYTHTHTHTHTCTHAHKNRKRLQSTRPQGVTQPPLSNAYSFAFLAQRN
jgi:hypothetical protein